MAFAQGSISTSGNNTIITGGVTGIDAVNKRCRVSYLELECTGTGPVTVGIYSGTTLLDSVILEAAGSSALFEKHSQDGSGNSQYVFTCNQGDAFILNLSGAIAVQYYVRYVRR